MRFKNIINPIILEYIVISILSIYFFLWSQSLLVFDERLLLIILIPIYFFSKQEILDKSLIKYFSILILFISIHLVLNNIFFNNSVFLNFEAIVGSLVIATVVVMYHSLIVKNLSKIIYLFVLVLFSFFLFENLFVGNIYSINNFDCLNGWFSNAGAVAAYNAEHGTNYTTAKFKLFSENSHFGMIAPAIISYLIFMNYDKNYLNFLNIIIIFFLFLFLSTTLLVSTIVCITFFLILKFKFIKNFQKITAVFFILISLLIVFSKPQCNMRLTETIQGVFINFSSKYNQDPSIKNNWIKTLPHEMLNQSSEVTLNSYMVSINSFINNPFGTGINNYIYQFKKISEDLSLKTWDVNQQDGSNNFSKLITEFGIFSLILFYLIFNCMLKDNKNFSKNIFFYSIIITQLIRGAGYFNGGYLLCVFIILTFIYNKNYDQNSSK